MEKKSIIIVLLLLLVGFMFVRNISDDEQYNEENVMANHYSEDNYIYREKIIKTNCPSEGKEPVTRKIIYVDGDNDKRYPIYDYRHGYTYRITEEYSENYERKIIVEHEDLDSYEKSGDEYYYYYKYVPHMREYEKITCYKVAPTDKLFYKKCPGY